ncbi:hypothetical protein BDZ45DRAFT_772935 [Acephala macrosclerotiorum]|nr:hypothetical protein BDZ45DRAFT_772935 [Acephala macrosclerotiorum]
MFTPQFPEGRSTLQHLKNSQSLFENSAGGHIGNLAINFGIGGLLFTKQVPLTGALPGTLAWGGLPNMMRWGNRERGVAGVYATQVIPHSDVRNTKLAALFQSLWKMVAKDGQAWS